jgi:V/A-type H+-transporting ATPase subunit I
VSIVRLCKVSLCGPQQEKNLVLAELQKLGLVHLVSLRPAPSEPEQALTPHAEETYKALKYLRRTPNKRRPLRHSEEFHIHETVAQTLANRQQLREVSDRRDALAQRIRELEPWGEFSFPPPQDLAGVKLWFYILPVNQQASLAAIDLPWQIVHRDNRHAYVVVLSRDEPAPDLLPVVRTHTGAKPLSQLRRELEDAEIELEDVNAKRETLTRWLYLIEQNLNRAEDTAALQFARQQTLDGEGVFAVQGWLPEKDIGRLQKFADRNRLALLTEPPELDDRPPTLYHNPRALSGGQDLVDFYQTPGYRSWDPSAVVFFSFAAFFAMILADAGYALVLALILAWLWKRMGRTTLGQRLRLLFSVMVGAALGYGMLVGSYFGMSPKDGGALQWLQLLDLQDFDTMMALSIGIGCTHVILANGLSAWHRPGWLLRIQPLGWIALTLGGLALWLGAAAIGWTLLISGLGAVLLFTDLRPVGHWSDGLKRLLAGLLSLTNLTKLFGDVLSYLRLFALGLASASLALTFNQLATQVADALPGPGFFFSLLILLLGHALNLALSLMSGVVHGLRLNFIEFFNWGVSEEGYPFKAFIKKETRNG